MATIAENLQKIIDSKAAIKASINAKGGTITDSTPLDEYATAIDNLPSGGSSSYVKPADDAEVVAPIYGLSSLIKELNVGTINSSNNFYQSSSMSVEGLIPTKTGNIYANVDIHSNLEKISWTGTLPSSSSYNVSRNAFENLQKLKILNGVLKPSAIAQRAFANTLALESINIDFSICTSIQSSAFVNCGCNAFEDDNTKRGVLGNAVFDLTRNVGIESYAFANANFNSITINGTNFNNSYIFGILGRTITIGTSCTNLHAQAFEIPSGDHVNSSGVVTSYNSNCCVQIITMKATTPPTIGGGAFGTITKNSLQHIYVPSDSVAAYQSATQWSALASIISADPNE